MPLGNIQLTPQLIQAVRDAADIVAIASEHTRLKKSGRRHQGLCPLHKEKTPSFSVDPVQGLFYCFGCGVGGDAIKLHMLITGDDFPAAIESLAQRYGIPLPRGGPRGRQGDERDLGPVLTAAAEFFVAQLRRSPRALGYLENRGIPSRIVEAFGLGYAPDSWRALTDTLRQRFPLADVEAAGLVVRSETAGSSHYDRFRHRLIFPIHSPSGRLVGFGGRTLGEDRAKYINTSETERFHKGRLLYGLHRARRAIRDTRRVVLVEGYFDALAVATSGIDWVVGGMGTALTPEQARLLARYGEEVLVGFDGDTAGEEAFRRALPQLLREGLVVKRVELGAGQDPDSLRQEKGEAAVVAAVEAARDAVRRELERLIPRNAASDPQQQARAAAAVGELLAPIPDAVLRFGYGRLAAERLGIPVDLLLRRLGGPGAKKSGAKPEREEGPRLMRSLEQRTLQLLLEEGQDLPPVEDLPPEDSFLDGDCRNIYRAFCDLYMQGSSMGSPAVRSILSRLGSEGGAVDRVAQILLEESPRSKAGELRESLRQLRRDWQQRRLRDLAREINEAQRVGDALRLERLLEEKTILSRSLHLPASTGENGPG